MSPHGCRKRSAKPCNRYAEENFLVLGLNNQTPKPPNYLLIQDKAFYSLPWNSWGPCCPTRVGRPAVQRASMWRVSPLIGEHRPSRVPRGIAVVGGLPPKTASTGAKS